MLLKKILCNKYITVVAFLLFVVALAVVSVGSKKDLVAFRIGAEPKYIDYDFDMALRVLKDKFEEKGYKVGEFAYSGNLYPRELDDAKINVFVRGFMPFYDKRFNEDAVNVFYVHRIEDMLKQEFDKFDYYLTSQKNILREFVNKDNIEYFGADNLMREAIEGEYDCDVLYIYEYKNYNYLDFLKSSVKSEVLSGSAFYRLSDDEKQALLKRCKVVTYSKTDGARDDKEYIPFAVYDIMSYGRPIITNYNSVLEKTYDGILMFRDEYDLIKVTVDALNMTDEERDRIALKYKEILDGESVDISFIDKFKKKNKIIKSYLDNIN